MDTIDAATIKTIRAKLGKTREEFAQYIGVTLSTVWRWETGATKAKSTSVLRRLHAALKRSERGTR